jgi:oxidoreductase, dadA family
LKNVFAASGLGSSGLTTGLIIGYSIANMILGRENELDSQDYDINSYITIKE